MQRSHPHPLALAPVSRRRLTDTSFLLSAVLAPPILAAAFRITTSAFYPITVADLCSAQHEQSDDLGGQSICIAVEIPTLELMAHTNLHRLLGRHTASNGRSESPIATSQVRRRKDQAISRATAPRSVTRVAASQAPAGNANSICGNIDANLLGLSGASLPSWESACALENLVPGAVLASLLEQTLMCPVDLQFSHIRLTS